MSKFCFFFLFLFFHNSVNAQILSFELFKVFVSKDVDIPLSTKSQDLLGNSSPLGDIDGDGINDIVLCAQGVGEEQNGQLAVVFLNSDGSVKDYQFIGNGHGDFSGNSVNNAALGIGIDTVGDLNKDGTVDLVVGAYQDNNGVIYGGAVYILFLNPDGRVKKYQKIAQNSGGLNTIDGSDKLGIEVSDAGDIDGDGNHDIFVSAYEDDEAGVNMGSVYIMYLNSDGTVKNQTRILPTVPHFDEVISQAQFGNGMTNIGDVDGNGMTDLSIAVKNDAIYIVLLNKDGTVKSTKYIDNSHPVIGLKCAPNSRFGRSLKAIPDLNYDGINELLIGSYLGPNENGVGEVYIAYLNSSGDIYAYETINESTLPELSLNSSDYFGMALSYLGDINADGFPEIGIGESHNSDSVVNGGATYIITLKPKQCSNQDCVWPGDANKDGVVNSKDIIQIGCCFSRTSLNKRILPVNYWLEQSCENWDTVIHKINVKHSDSDGNGVVNFLDASVVEKNYSKVSFKMAETVPTDPYGPPLYIISNRDIVSSQDSIVYSISLGDSTTPAENVYGVSMTLKHEVEDVFGSINSASFTGSWLGTKNVDMIATGFPLDDGIDIGMARTDQTNRTGYGYLAKVDIVTPDNLVEMNKDLVLEITDLTIISYEGDTISPNIIYGDPVFILNKEEFNVNELKKGLKVYPNPNSGILNIDSKLQLDKIRIMDLSGRLIHELFIPSQHEVLNLSDFEKGVYLIEFQSGNLTAYERVFVQ